MPRPIHVPLHREAKKPKSDDFSFLPPPLHEIRARFPGTSDDPDFDLIDQGLNSLLETYGSSGYAQIALLNKASFDANNNNFEESFERLHLILKLAFYIL